MLASLGYWLHKTLRTLSILLFVAVFPSTRLAPEAVPTLGTVTAVMIVAWWLLTPRRVSPDKLKPEGHYIVMDGLFGVVCQYSGETHPSEWSRFVFRAGPIVFKFDVNQVNNYIRGY